MKLSFLAYFQHCVKTYKLHSELSDLKCYTLGKARVKKKKKNKQ